MNTTAEKIYGAYRFESSHDLTDEHFAQLISVFNTPIQTITPTLEGRAAPSAIHITGIGPVVIKHYRRGGILGRFVKCTYLKWGKTRCQVEYSQLKSAWHSGISVPEPLICAYKGRLFYQAWLITREITNQMSLASLSFIDAKRTQIALKKLFKQVALLIENRIYHPDLHPGNVLVDSENRIYIIDFDKARYYKRSTDKLRRIYMNRWNRAVQKYHLSAALFLNNSGI